MHGDQNLGGTPQTARPCRVVPRGESQIGPTRADAAKIGADAAEIGADATKIGPTRSVSAVSADIGRNGPIWAEIQKKKKKKVQRTIWLNLNTQTPSDPHTSSKTPKHPLSLRPSNFQIFNLVDYI